MKHILVRAFVVWSFFIPLAYFLDRNDLFHLLNTGVFCAATTVLIAYMPAVIEAIRVGNALTRAHYLVLGIATVWTGLLIRTATVWTWRHLGKDNELLDAWWFALALYIILTGAFLQLAAYDYMELSPHGSYWRRVGIITGLAMAIAYLSWAF